MLKDKIFQKLFKTAEIAKFNSEELKQYEASVNAYRDIKNSIDTAFEKGEVKGKIEGKIEIAKQMKKDKLDLDLIMKYTGLTEKEINGLK